jgi:Predicted ATPase
MLHDTNIENNIESSQCNTPDNKNNITDKINMGEVDRRLTNADLPVNEEVDTFDFMLEHKDEWRDNKGSILENRFIELYKECEQLKYINKQYYNLNGLVSKNKLKQDVQNIVKNFVSQRITTTVNSICSALENECLDCDYEPVENEIHTISHKLVVNNNGTFTLYPREVSPNKLNVDYVMGDDKPVIFLKFLADLLTSEEICILQEYIGYCLIPTLKAQKSLFIIGQSGSGKSQLGKLLDEMFKNSILNENKISILFNNSFGLGQIANKLLIYIDEIEDDTLKDTGIFKTLISGGQIQTELKFQDRTPVKHYTRLFVCGNQMLKTSKCDKEALKNRLVILNTKEVPKDREPDVDLSTKLIAEKNLIFKWALEGLFRFIGNNYKFSHKDIISKQFDDMLADNDKSAYIEEFLESGRGAYFRFDENAEMWTEEIYYSYCDWAKSKGKDIVDYNTFAKDFKNVHRQHSLECIYITKQGDDGLPNKRRGYKGIGFGMLGFEFEAVI